MKKLYSTTAEFANKEISDKKTLTYVKFLGIISILLLFSIGVRAATYYSIASGNWNTKTTWSLTSGGSTVADTIPTAGDNVIIQGGRTVTVSANTACANIQVGGSGTGILAFGSTNSVTLTTGNVTVNSGSKITSTTNGNQPHNFYISGNINCVGTWDMFGKNATDDINVFLNGTTQNITGNGTYGWKSLTIENSSTTSVNSTSAQTINGNLNIAGILNFGTARFNRPSLGGALTVSGKMILGSNTGGQIGSNFPTNFSATTLTGGTVEYNFAGAQTIYAAPTYTNVTLSGSGTKTITNAKVNGILSMEGTATTTGVPTYGSVATLQYKGTASITTSNNEFPAAFSGSGGVIIDQGTGNTVTLNGNKTGMAGDLNIKSGTLNLSTFTINRSAAGGTLTIASGATLKIGGTNTFPTNYLNHSINCSSTTEYSGSNQTIANLNSSQSYGNLTLSGSGIKTLQTGTTAICNNFTITGTANTTGVTGLTIGGNVFVDATASFTAGAFEHFVGGNWTKTGTFNATGSTINFNGGISQNIGASSFNNVTFSNAGTKVATGTLTISGNVTIGTNFTAGAYNHSVTGNWTNNGTFTAGNGTITLNSSTLNTIGGSTNSQFYNLIINETGSSALGINTTVTGTLTLTKGLLDIGAFTLTTGDISGGNSTSYIKTSSTGRLKRLVTTGGTVFVFPVGNSAYNPISFSSTAIGNGNSDYFSIRVEDGPLTNANVNDKTINRKWYLMCATTGVTSLTVAPTFNAGETGSLFNAGLSPKIGFFTGTAWGYGPGTAGGSGPYTVTASGTAPDATSPNAFIAIGSENAFSASKLSITVLPPTPYRGVNSSVATVQTQNSLGVPTWLLSNTTFDLTSNKSFERVGGLTGFTINAGTHEKVINNLNFLVSTWSDYSQSYVDSAMVTATRTSGESLADGVTPYFAILDGSIYRPRTSGDWSTVQWEISSNGGNSWRDTVPPTNNIFSNADVIQIPSNITLTADVPASFYSLLLFGTLDINNSGTLTINHSTSDSNDYNIQVYGTLKNSGGALINSNSNYIGVNVNGGTYWHNMDGGSIPVANWNSLNGAPSTCKITGLTTTAITGGLDQNFQNFIWDNGSQSVTQSLINDMTVRNTLTLTNGVITTNDKKVVLELGGTTSSTNNSRINGNVRIHIPTTTSPTINFPIGDTNYYTPLSVAFNGTIVGSGYLDAYTSATQPPLAAGLSQSKYINRVWSVSNTNISGFTSFNTTFTFADADKIGNPDTTALVVRKRDNNIWAVTSVGTRTANTTECTGMTSFSTFVIGEDDCTANNYTWLGGTNSDWNTATNWCYNKVPSDTVNVIIPADPINQPIIGAAGGVCKNLTISNGASLTISGSNSLSIKGNLNNDGTFTTNSSTVSFNGISAQTITGSTTFNNLTINNGAGVTASSNLTVNGILHLQSSNPSATTGTLDMGSDTLNMGINATNTGNGDVTGIITRTHNFAINDIYTFGNPNSTVRFNAVSGNQTFPTSISIKVNIGTDIAWGSTTPSNSVKRQYELSYTGSAAGNHTIFRAAYLDSELALGTNETTLAIWSHVPETDITTDEGWSSYDITQNYITISDIDFANLPQVLQVSIAPTSATVYNWNGSQSTDWNSASNWTPNGVPTSDYGVVIPDSATTAHDPELPIGATAQYLIIESGGVLNSTSNATLTLAGSGNIWATEAATDTIPAGIFNAGTSTVTVSNTSAFSTIVGSTDFYNLNILDNAQLRMTAGSYVGISGTLSLSSNGVLDARTSSNTIEFKGTNQTIPVTNFATPGYTNLVINSGANGTIIWPSTLNIGGNFINNKTGLSAQGTVIFDGSSVQTIDGTASITFNNLTINNAAGVIGSTDIAMNGKLLFVTDNPTSNDKGALAMSADKIFDMGINSSTAGPGDVTGIIRRNHNFETSTYYSFGNENNGVTFATVSGYPGQIMPTSLSLKIDIGTVSNWSGTGYSGTAPTNPIKRSFEIIQTGGSGNKATMQVHYRDNEVPAGITEDQLTIWTSTYNSGTFYNKEAGRSNYNTDLNFVSIQDVDLNLIPSTWGNFKATLAPTSAINYTWIGITDTDWSKASNWTPNGVPDATHGAIIPNTYTTPNAPKLPSNPTCKSIQINAGGVLNAPATNGILTITGANNAWSVEPGGVFNANTCMVYFTANATTEGNTSISGSTNFYSLTIGSGVLLRPAAECYIGIKKTLTNGGTFDAATNENTIEFNGATSQAIPNPNGNTTGYHNLVLSGSGMKTLPSSLSIIDEFINNTDSVNAGSGTVSFSGNSLYGQKISGSAVTRFNNLTIDNPTNQVSVLSDIAVNGILTTTNGSILDMGTSALSGSIASTSGSGSIYTQNSSSTPIPSGKTWSGKVVYNGTIAQTAVAGTYNNLTISNIAGCTAGGNITVNQMLNLAADNPSATHGLLELVTNWLNYPSTGNATPESFNSYSLYMGATAKTTGPGDVSGIIKRNYAIDANTSYTFGNEFTTIVLTRGASSVIPDSIAVVSKIGSTPVGKENAIQRSYQIIPASNGANCFVSGNFHYLDSELQSSISPNVQNTESKLVTWDYDIDGGFAVPDEHGRAAYDFNNNFIGLSNVPVSYFITNESHNWKTIITLADHSDTLYLTWKGNTSSDWTDGSNWFPIGNVPDSTTYVIIPDSSTTNYSPALPDTATVNTLTIENGGSIAMGTGTLIIKNGMSGGWEDHNSEGNDPGNSTVVFANPGATVSGTARFHNLTISPNATLTNAANSIIKVSNTVSNNGSWFTDNSNNTVEYTGTSQNITLPAGAPNYHNLVLSGNDTINFPNSALCIDGDLIIGSNITTNINQNLTVKGDFTNNSPNFTNNAGTITFNGTKNQNINGTGTTIFKKLTIDNNGYTVSAGSSFGVLDTLKLNSGSVLDMESQSLTAVGTISGSGTLTTQNTGTSPLPADKTWSCNVIYNNQTAAQSVAAGTYNNLKISNPIGANASGTINATTLTIDSRAILHMGTNILNSITTNNGTGTLTTQNTGSTPIPTGKTWTSQVVYNGSEAQTAVKGTFNSLIIDNATGVSVANNDSISVKGYLFINNSKKLVIPTNTVMNAQTISNNAGASGITIKSDSTAANGSLIFHNSAGSPVSATVEMFSKAFALDYNPTTKTYSNYKWEFFGVPLQSIVPFPIFNGSYIRKHSESGTSSATHWLTVSNSTVLTPVDGYEITQPIAKTITFQGQLVNSDYTKTLPYTPGSTFIGQSVLSNPYTAAIDIAQLNFGNGTDATVYIYNTGSIGDWSKSSDENSAGQYLAIPKGVAALRMEGFQWKIPSMQGFLVKTTSTSTLGIPYSAVISKNTDRQKVRSSSSSSSNVYTKIDVAGTRYSDKMWIITNPTCSHGFDNGWDGTKFLGSSLAPQIWAMETAGDYQVNGVDNINNTSLAFKSGENTTYTLTFTHESSTSAYPSLYLVDLLDNHITDITASGSQYTFNSNQTSTPTTARFKIVTNLGITTEEGQLSNSLNVFNSMNTIYVNNNSSLKGEVIICDITGRYIQKYPFNPNGLTTIATDLTTGVYLMRATTSENENIQKVIIK